MKRLLRLYPRAWRCRYQAEMEALLEETAPSVRVAFDLLMGALDARLHRRGRRLPPLVAAAGLALLGALALPWGTGLGPVALTASVLSGGLLCTLLGWRLPGWFACLLALRLACGAVQDLAGASWWLEAAGTGLWTVAAILLLRWAQYPWRLALPAAALLSVLGPGLLAPDHFWTAHATGQGLLGWWDGPAAAVAALRHSAWAALLAGLIAARPRRWRLGGGPGGWGAAPARPQPGSPAPPLAAVAGRPRDDERLAGAARR